MSLEDMMQASADQEYQPYGPTDKTWHYGYNKDELYKLQDYYKYHVLRYIVSASWSENDNGWIVEHVSLEAYNNSGRKW